MSTILVVDDDPNILTALRFLLEPEGYHVLTAQNGEAALAAAGIESPALVVTDWKMPRLDGVELCWRLRRSRATAGILLVMAAGTLPAALGRAAVGRVSSEAGAGSLPAQRHPRAPVAGLVRHEREPIGHTLLLHMRVQFKRSRRCRNKNRRRASRAARSAVSPTGRALRTKCRRT
ncbi:response regulator [Paraburkholderia tuberum]|uniref:response regulator n=1 Tax=Paraburkholderia tuberum TaxID=157910 RepID=UPI000B88A025|nr:response regulator [Paraburkholderia tuberum]